MRYYWPFGTTQNLMIYEQDRWRGDHAGINMPTPLALFHFDQEPIYTDDEATIVESIGWWRPSKYPKLLANSERSSLKKTICKRNELIDWYFFYHGFAALDWYRDAIFLDYEHPVVKPFLSFNHLVRQKRAYRMALTARLIQSDIFHLGSVSFHGTPNDCQLELLDPATLLSDHSQNLIRQHLAESVHTPTILDRSMIDGSASAHFGHIEYLIRQESLFHLVNETVFYHDKLHLSEKIFQPIVCKRPFLLAAAPGNLEYLRNYGFKTFGDYVDESYDLEPDPDLRMDLIVKQLIMLSKLSVAQMRSMLDDMRPILEFNKAHFFGNFRQMIVEELVENFNQCIRVWNNGRVDGRDQTLHPNLELVKKTLLR
jgi:hypothetical protein